MTDANFRDYCMAGFIGAGSGLGAISVLLFGGHIYALSVVFSSTIAALLSARHMKARAAAQTQTPDAPRFAQRAPSA